MYERGRLNLYKKGRIGAADLHLNLNRDQKAILHTVGGPDEVAQRGRNTMQQHFLWWPRQRARRSDRNQCKSKIILQVSASFLVFY